MKKTSLKKGHHKTGGRSYGKITTHHRGGGHKKNFRLIDFQRKYTRGKILSIDYDPFRNAPIALVGADNKYSYILKTRKLTLGSWIQTPNTSLSKIRIGKNISCINGKFIRSAGTKGSLLNHLSNGESLIKLPSGEHRKVPSRWTAIEDQIDFSLKPRKLTKAGQKRWLGRRPIVRGVAKNPVDHPHGGGNGKTSGGRPSCGPFGMRKSKKKNRSYILKLK